MSNRQFKRQARVWQDRELHFDSPLSSLKTRKGEEEIDSINSVEDTKGNNGERGFLIITNLRLIWASHKQPMTNLSIGLNCITSINTKAASSRLKGSTQALYVMTKFQSSRFEFVFTSLVKNSPRMFLTVQSVHRSYETTRLYRDLKLRGAIIKEKTLCLLPDEKVYTQLSGVWNLSSDQGNLGTLFVTNIRVVWHANLAENFNVSIPYLQIQSIRLRDSKFGLALVVQTHPDGGGYILGFRIDPEAKLKEIHSELKSMYEVYAKNPNFGIHFEVDEKPQALNTLKVARTEDNVKIVDVDDGLESLAAYSVDHAISRGSKGEGEDGSDEPVFNTDLGLAMAPMPDGYTTKNLWLLF